MSKNEEKRNRVVKETIYSYGLRASELTDLKLLEFIKVFLESFKSS